MAAASGSPGSGGHAQHKTTLNIMLRPININAVLNGFVVQVGCQTLAYTSRDKLLADIGSYLNDPEGTEKRLLVEEGINRKHTMGEDRPQPVQDCAVTPRGLVGAGMTAGGAQCGQAIGY